MTAQGRGPIESQPPLLLRSALVGATTALATPAFPVVFVNTFLTFWADPQTRMAITGGTSMVFFSIMTAMPNSFYYAPILLPFAVGNGLTAAGLYLAGDVACGGPERLVERLSPVPVGAAIGAATALAVPFAYPLCWALVYPSKCAAEAASSAATYELIVQVCFTHSGMYVWPCLLATGVISGGFLHLFLHPVVVGVPGVSWQTLAGTVLALSSVGLAALYSTATRTSVPHLGEVDVEDAKYQRWLFPPRARCFVAGLQEFLWAPGVDPDTGDVVSERFRLTELPDGRLELAADGVRESGVGRAVWARELAKKSVDYRVKCYASQRAAYFDGLVDSPMDKGLIDNLASALQPLAGERVVTDLLVLLAVGRVPREKLQESLRELAPELRADGLASRLRSRWSRAGGAGASALLAEGAVRSAELRELARLEGGALRSPVAAESLRRSLRAAGVDVDRALASLAELAWADGPGDRAADWAAIEGRRAAGRAAVVSVSVVVAAAAAAGLAALLLDARR